MSFLHHVRAAVKIVQICNRNMLCCAIFKNVHTHDLYRLVTTEFTLDQISTFLQM